MYLLYIIIPCSSLFLSVFLFISVIQNFKFLFAENGLVAYQDGKKVGQEVLLIVLIKTTKT